MVGKAKKLGRIWNSKLLFHDRVFSVPLPDGPFVFAGLCSKIYNFASERRIFCRSRMRFAGGGKFLK
jgi:hypothetical protein